MDTDRRGFLRLSAGAAALLWPLRSGGADAGAQTALGMHRATRNTRLGATGTAVRRALWTELPPFKEYAGLRRDALAAPSWETGRALSAVAHGYRPARAFVPEPISREQLARILFLANGVTGQHAGRSLRAAPSAGALYAGELYAVVERVTGVSPGIHYYDVEAHALVPLRGGPFLAEVARGQGDPPDASRAAAAVLLTNVFERYRVRYAERGDRYALIDSGHIGENLRLAATELGLGEAAPAHFEKDRLDALLGVDGREEAVCAVHWVGRAGEIESGAAPGMPVHAAIRQRRSTRRFESRVLARADLLAVLALARQNPALHRSTRLDLLVVAHRVADTPAGVYRYEPAAGRLAEIRRGELAHALVRACIGQEKTGQAAAAVVAVARLSESDDERLYRNVLLDAGATAQRIYLAAEARGLSARNLAAFYDDELDTLLGLDGEREVAVHLTAVGWGD
jgi:SagB-type dehydrogenase family enzyme